MKTVIKWVLIIIVGFYILSMIQTKWENQYKYDGQTAEEWFNEYDWLVGCVQDHPYTAYKECI